VSQPSPYLLALLILIAVGALIPTTFYLIFYLVMFVLDPVGVLHDHETVLQLAKWAAIFAGCVLILKYVWKFRGPSVS
jgi:hypothetical protein